MRRSDWIVLVGAIIVGGGLIIGLIYLLSWDYQNDNKAYAEQCQQVAELAGVTEYKSSYSDCYIVKDGKIIEIK